MSSLRVLDLVKPFGAFLPEIISPERKPTFQTRITWTGTLCTQNTVGLTFRSNTSDFSGYEPSTSLRDRLIRFV